MSAKSSRRKYGSLEDPIKPRGAHRPPRERTSFDASADRSSFEFDPSLDLRRRARGEVGAGFRWVALVVVGLVAVGVMIGLSRTGY
ncbi:unnamed protein product, partial [Scytosiphon promiscuus]